MEAAGLQVVAAGSAGPVEEPPPASPAEAAPAAAGPLSPLDILRGKREALVAKLHKDLAVPRWDAVLGGSRLWVRYKPGDPSILDAAIRRRGGVKPQPKDWLVLANADYLVDACVAVFVLPADAVPDASLEGMDLPRFGDPGLAEALGVLVRDASLVCRAVYATDGDLLAAAGTIMEWSGTTMPEVDEAFLTS